jgi:Uma2 family endonuclease
MSSELALSCGQYSWYDYERWDEKYRCELIDGIVYMMAPPSLWHQDVVLAIGSQLRELLKGKKCKPYVSPVGVRLFSLANKADMDVLLPDVIVVCDESKLVSDVACEGAPDVVFEVLSESTKAMDLRIKKQLYKEAGVKEYWVIAKDHAIRWIWSDDRDDELRFMRANGVISMEIETLSLRIELDA